MESPELKLVRPSGAADATPGRSLASALGLGALALLCAMAATWLGADLARRPRAMATAREALYRVIESGPNDPGVRELVLDLRRQIGVRPLDARARALYAGLLLEMGSGPEDIAAPSFHAARAYELAPVTVPVVRAAAVVMSRSGNGDRAADMVHEMFGYEPTSAAELLVTLEPFLDPVEFDRSIPETPAAWLAWARTLDSRGREAEAESRLDLAWKRWPREVAVLHTVGLRAAKDGDLDRLTAVVPAEIELPAEPEAALVWTFRAWVKAEGGDADGARHDVARALELDGRSGSVLIWAGDALLAAKDPAGARRTWNRALFVLPAGATGMRQAVAVRLARLEDAHGRPADALRAWRLVAEQSPDHREARTRIEELGGVPPPATRP